MKVFLHLHGLIVITDNAYVELQRKDNSSEACRPGSVFRDYYDACQECIQDNRSDGPEPGPEPSRDYVEPAFAQILTFCDTYTPTAVPLSSTSSLSRHTITGTTLYTTSNNGIETVVTSIFEYQSLPPVPVTATAITTILGSTGPEAIQILTTYMTLPSPFSAKDITSTGSQDTPSGMLPDLR